jgi:hypothetical protein
MTHDSIATIAVSAQLRNRYAAIVSAALR